MRKSILYLSLCLVFAVSMLGVGIFLFNDLNFSSVETQLNKSEEDETPETQGWSGNLLAYVKLYKNGSLSSLTSGFKISLYGTKAGPPDLITSSTNGSLQYDLSSLSSSYYGAYLSVSRNGAGGEADGYSFSGWYTSSSCTGQTVSLYSQYISSGTTTYYARYNYSDAYFTLNDNGGSGGDGSMSATYGQAYPSVTVPSRTGYAFSGYWTSPSGGSQYYDSNGNPTQTYCSYNHNQSTPTLFAQWAPVSYTVTYHYWSSSGDTKDVKTYNCNKTYYYPTWSTYSFNTNHSWSGLSGWATSTTSTSHTYSAGGSFNNLVSAGSNLDLYAITTRTVSLSYHGNGATGGSTSSSSTTQYGNLWGTTYVSSVSFNVATNGFTRTGYSFNSWNTSYDGSGTSYSSGDSVSLWSRYLDSANQTFSAIWTVNNYHLDLQGCLDGINTWGIYQYATCDIYVNGSCVASGAYDYNELHPYGSTYEFKNFKVYTDKEYLGLAADSAPISGTITGETILYPSLRTKTWNDYAASSFASGSGTVDSPYIIKTAAQLAKVAKDSRSSTLSGKCYKLGADIDLSAHVWEGIGNSGYRFSGIFDGSLYQIKSMKTGIDSYQAPEEIGLFSYVQNPCVIKNIVMNSAFVTPGKTRDCGIIVGAGESSGMLITNCMVVFSRIQGGYSNCSYGGIAGRFTNGTISNCLTRSVEIYVEGTAAGICGWRGTVKDCAVIGGSISSGWDLTNRKVAVGWSDNTTIISSYGFVFQSKDRVDEKIMYGSSSDFGNWTYSPAINDGYPVQKTLFHIGGMSGSTAVYNYLKNTLGFTVI